MKKLKNFAWIFAFNLCVWTSCASSPQNSRTPATDVPGEASLRLQSYVKSFHAAKTPGEFAELFKAGISDELCRFGDADAILLCAQLQVLAPFEGFLDRLKPVIADKPQRLRFAKNFVKSLGLDIQFQRKAPAAKFFTEWNVKTSPLLTEFKSWDDFQQYIKTTIAPRFLKAYELTQKLQSTRKSIAWFPSVFSKIRGERSRNPANAQNFHWLRPESLSQPLAQLSFSLAILDWMGENFVAEKFRLKWVSGKKLDMKSYPFLTEESFKSNRHLQHADYWTKFSLKIPRNSMNSTLIAKPFGCEPNEENSQKCTEKLNEFKGQTERAPSSDAHKEQSSACNSIFSG